MRHALTFVIGLAVLGGWLLAGADEDGAPEPKSYDNAKVVRIKAVEGEAFVQRSYEEGFEEATVNLPLFENDSAGTTDGRLEIYLGRMNYVRLDNDTRVQLLRVPELRRTDLKLRIERGGVYLEVANLDNERAVEVQTPDCGVFVLDAGSYRINVLEKGRTEILVVEGLAEVSGTHASRNVRENQKMVVSAGVVTERPYYFYASDRDDFDGWNEERNREMGHSRYSSARYLEQGYEDYEYELTRNGRWSYMNDFGCNVWIPYHLGSDWSPYWNGRWVWNPFYGYVWTSFDSWGWFTHHYGRWHWDHGYGWCWMPGYRWSPAWVHWFWDNDYYGWCPLSRWNRPIVLFGDRWDRHYNHHHGLPWRSRSTIVLRKGELSSPNISRVAIRRGSLRQDEDRVVAFHGGEAPSGRIDNPRMTVVNRRGEQMVFKRGGVVSSSRAEAGDVDTRTRTTDDRVITYRPRAGSGGGKYSGTTVRRSDGESSGGGSVRVRRDGGSGSDRGAATVKKSGGGSSGSSGGNSGAVVKKKDKDSRAPAWAPTASGAPAGDDRSASYRSVLGKYSRDGGAAGARYGGEFRYRGTYSLEGGTITVRSRPDGGYPVRGTDRSTVYQGHQPTAHYPGTAVAEDGEDGRADGAPLMSYSSRRTYSPSRTESGGSRSLGRSTWSRSSAGSDRGSSGRISGPVRHGGSVSSSRGSSSSRSSGSGHSGGSIRKRN